MDIINKAVRQHLFEVLSEKYRCKIGSEHVDCSYLDYSQALEVGVDGELILVLFNIGAPPPNTGVRVMWAGGPMAYKDLLQEAVVPDIAEPDFASFTKRIVDVLADFRLITHVDDS